MKNKFNTFSKVLIFTFLIPFFISCGQEDIAIDEDLEIEKYLEANNITAEPVEDGLYVIKERTGIGKEIDINSEVQVYYTGYLLKGMTIFDSIETGEPYTFKMESSNNIEGWNRSFELLREGDSAKIIMHSKWAYGANKYGSIPAYSTIIFDVSIVSVK